MLDKRAAAKASVHLSDYAVEKRIYMKINYFNSDHTHGLIDLPTSMCIEELIQEYELFVRRYGLEWRDEVNR